MPHDFSATSDAALRRAVALAVPFASDGQVAEEDKERLLRMLTPMDRVTLHPRFFVRAGTPAAEIVRFAAQQHADLIVMGTHGRGFVAHMLIGSVAEQVVRTAPCPVLTVGHPGQAGKGSTVAVEALEAARVGV